jgi:hypothetical protein
MPNNKSPEQLQAEIDALQALKSVVRAVNRSGEDQHRAIDVQIEILGLLQTQPTSGESLLDGFDSTPTDYSHASHALDWATGTDEIAPSDKWSAHPLIIGLL